MSWHRSVRLRCSSSFPGLHLLPSRDRPFSFLSVVSLSHSLLKLCSCPLSSPPHRRSSPVHIAGTTPLESVFSPISSASLILEGRTKKIMTSQFASDWRRSSTFAHPSDSWNSTFSIPAVRITTPKRENQYPAANGSCKYLV